MTMDDEDDNAPLPRHNSLLRGQKEAENVLLKSFENNTLPHAWLLSGPRGIGKATLAYRFARYVLSIGGNGCVQTGLFGEDLAGESGGLFVSEDDPVFRRVAGAAHADFLSVERGLNDKGKLRSEIIVDDVRGIGSFLNLTPAEGGWRVVIIDSADEMNTNAANAVLKVLEEPPSRTLLLLVSHSPGRLLPTIRSRCRSLVLKTLEEQIVVDLALKYLPKLDHKDALELARLSDGSIGRVIDLAEEGGLDLFRDLFGLLKTLPDFDVVALHKFGDKVGKAGANDSFRVVSDLLRWWLGRLILLGAGKKQPAGADAEEIALMSRLINAGGIDQWLEVWEKIIHMLERTESAYLDRKQVILNVFLTMKYTVQP